jgi:hypothetical protein
MFDNSIEPGNPVRRPDTSRKDVQGDDMPIREATRAEEKRRRPTAADADTDAVAKRHNLYTVDRRFPAKARIYYSDYQQKSEIMRAKPQQITTRLDDRRTVSAMLDLAQSRNWQTIRLRGSDSFVREAWVQAQVRGIQTEGYKPANTDLQELQRRKTAAAPVAAATEVAARAEAKRAEPAEAAQRQAERRKAAAAPAASATVAAARPEAKPAKPTVAAQRAQEKAVWNVVETSGKAAREQDGAKVAAKPAEKSVEAA